jgi:hypothetical protein
MDPDYSPDGIQPYPRKSDGGCPHSGACGHDTCSDPTWPDLGDCPGECGSPCNPEATGEQLCDSWFTGVTFPGPPGPGLRTCVGGTVHDYNCYKRCAVYSATNSGPDCAIVTTVPHDLPTGQLVRLINVPGLEGMSLPVTATDEFNFSVPGNLTSAYTSGGFVNIDLSACRKVGFKNAQSRKAWHGQFGFNTEWGGICFQLDYPYPLTSPPCSGASGCTSGCTCLWEPYQGSPPINKYLDWQIVAHSATIVGGVTTAYADLSRKVTVNRVSGCQSFAGCSDSYSDLGAMTALQNALTGPTGLPYSPCSLGPNLPVNGVFFISTMMAWWRPVAALFTCSGTVDSSISGCEPVYSCTATDIVTGHVITTLSVNGTSGTADWVNKDIDGNLICEVHMSLSETHCHFEATSYGSPGSGDKSVFTVDNYLSNPYSAAQLYADARFLLNRIDISDDIIYPWRTDGFISIAPLMTYDESIPTEPNIGDAAQTLCPLTDPDCTFSGAIMGDILPKGYGPHFAWNHRSFRSCNQGGPNDPAHYLYAWGAWAHNPPNSSVPPYSFTSGTTPVISWRSSGGTTYFKTNAVVPGWTGAETVGICGTGQIDGIYYISGPTGTGPYEYSIIPPQVNNAPFLPGCAGGVCGVVTMSTDATFYTVGDITDLAMPRGATQWTENWQDPLYSSGPLTPGQLPPGAWAFFTQDYMMLQKWAEIKVHRPSYNFARPCGIDKWMLDETKVTCVESSDGSTPPVLTLFADVGLVADDLVYVCGVTGPPSVPDGVYKITGSGTSVTLTTDCTMRSIFSATQSGPNVDIVMTDPMATINTGDSVDFVGVDGLGAGLSVTVTDSTHFSVPGTLSGAYSAGGYAFVSGSKAFQLAPMSIDFRCGSGNGTIGKIRFANVPGVCGRWSVQAAVQVGSEVKITTGTAHYLAQGESVNFNGVGSLGSGLIVKVLNSTQFMVTGTLGVVYHGGGNFVITAATVYQWNDDQSKGDFIYAEYHYNNRDFQQADRMCEQYHGGSYDVCGFAQAGCSECSAASPGFTCVEVAPGVWESDIRQTQWANGVDRAITNFIIEQECLPFEACNPQIMAIIFDDGPEHFSGTFYERYFPNTFVADWRYNSQWQAFFVQHVVDYLWQAPHKECTTCDCEEGMGRIIGGGPCAASYVPSPCPLAQDDGSCEVDDCTIVCTDHTGTNFYPHAPEVEALQGLPDDAIGSPAPAPPVGHVGWPTYSDVSSGPLTPGWLPLLPPLGPGYGPNAGVGGVDPTIPAVPEMPWILAIREWLCICADGRFKQEYLDNGQSINCPP